MEILFIWVVEYNITNSLYTDSPLDYTEQITDFSECFAHSVLAITSLEGMELWNIRLLSYSSMSLWVCKKSLQKLVDMTQRHYFSD